jgi:hypothetical protein
MLNPPTICGYRAQRATADITPSADIRPGFVLVVRIAVDIQRRMHIRCGDGIRRCDSLAVTDIQLRYLRISELCIPMGRISATDIFGASRLYGYNR